MSTWFHPWRVYKCVVILIVVAILLSCSGSDPGIINTGDPVSDGDLETPGIGDIDLEDELPSDGDKDRVDEDRFLDGDLDETEQVESTDTDFDLDVMELAENDVPEIEIEIEEECERDEESEWELEGELEFEFELEADIEPELETEPDPEPEPLIVIDRLAAFANPRNLLSYYIEWETDRPCLTALTVDCGSDYHESFAGTDLTAAHSVFVMGLLQLAECTATASAVNGEDAESTDSISFSVGEIPENLPEFSLDYSEQELLQSGWTLFNLNNHYDRIPLSLAMVDEQGRYRWYYTVNNAWFGEDNDVRTVPDGILIGGNTDNKYPHRIDWEGNILWSERFRMHHEMQVYGEGQYLFLNGEKSCEDPAISEWNSGGIYIWDVERAEVVYSWVLCHYYSPPDPRLDWSHLNALVWFPRENALLLSSREQYALFKINMDTEQIVWKMGVEGDFEIDPEDQFYRQHAPEIQPNGNILLFDNGHYTYRSYSRVIELAYTDTDESRTAEIVWSFVPDPPIFAPIWGDADRLPNGNTLATFGLRSTSQHSHLIEISNESPGRKIWDLSLPLKWGVYRSERILEPTKGYVLDSGSNR